jgi:hypothetical protein
LPCSVGTPFAEGIEILSERYLVSNFDPTIGPSIPSQAQNDARGTPRRRVLKSAIIAFNDRFCALPCAVRNLSATGANLRADGSITTPNTFALLIELDGLDADCQVVWRRDNEMGVRFLSAPRLLAPKRIQIVKPLANHPPPLRRKRPT